MYIVFYCFHTSAEHSRALIIVLAKRCYLLFPRFSTSFSIQDPSCSDKNASGNSMSCLSADASGFSTCGNRKSIAFHFILRDLLFDCFLYETLAIRYITARKLIKHLFADNFHCDSFKIGTFQQFLDRFFKHFIRWAFCFDYFS